ARTGRTKRRQVIPAVHRALIVGEVGIAKKVRPQGRGRRCASGISRVGGVGARPNGRQEETRAPGGSHHYLPAAESQVSRSSAREKPLAAPDGQFVNQVACNAVGRDVLPYRAFSLDVVRVLGRLIALEVADVARPRPGEVVEQAVGKA